MSTNSATTRSLARELACSLGAPTCRRTSGAATMACPHHSLTRLDVVIWGATPNGSVLCCDATLVSPLTCTGRLQPSRLQGRCRRRPCARYGSGQYTLQPIQSHPSLAEFGDDDESRADRCTGASFGYSCAQFALCTAFNFHADFCVLRLQHRSKACNNRRWKETRHGACAGSPCSRLCPARWTKHAMRRGSVWRCWNATSIATVHRPNFGPLRGVLCFNTPHEPPGNRRRTRPGIVVRGWR